MSVTEEVFHDVCVGVSSSPAGGGEAAAAGVVRIGLMPEPLLQLADAGLEGRHLLL